MIDNGNGVYRTSMIVKIMNRLPHSIIKEEYRKLNPLCTIETIKPKKRKHIAILEMFEKYFLKACGI
jgi:hypothetical protein